jgi:hypothetical protein
MIEQSILIFCLREFLLSPIEGQLKLRPFLVDLAKTLSPHRSAVFLFGFEV